MLDTEPGLRVEDTIQTVRRLEACGVDRETLEDDARAAAFARIVYYDQRGCGISDYRPGKGYSVAQAVEDLENLRRTLKIEKWTVLGHSYGGYLAQRYAMAHPENVAGLIVLTGEPGLPGKYSGTRQYDYISPEERRKMQEIRRELTALATHESGYTCVLMQGSGTFGVEAAVTVKPSYGLADEQIAQMLKDGFTHAEDDMAARSLREARVEAERMVLATRAALAIDGGLLSAEERAAVEALARETERIGAGTDAHAIEAAVAALAEGTEAFAAARMNQGIRQALAGRRVEDI